jgi:hypothetical protein
MLDVETTPDSPCIAPPQTCSISFQWRGSFSTEVFYANCMQDALTKTLPTWAAVLNRAVKRLRRRQQEQQEGAAADGAQPLAWDEDVHLPPWISNNERHQIEMRLEGWVDQLLEVRIAAL